MNLDNVVYFDEQTRLELEYLSSPQNAHYEDWETDPMGMMFYWHRLGLSVLFSVLLADLSVFLVAVAQMPSLPDRVAYWLEGISFAIDDFVHNIYDAAEDVL